MKEDKVTLEKPPRLLMGVSWLFWGAMQSQPLFGLVAAILFEARHWCSVRWQFGEKGFARAWQLSLLFLLGAIIFVFQIEDRDHTDFLAILAWLPFIMIPIGLAQQFASDQGVPLTTFSFVARRKLARDRELGRVVRLKRFELGYPFFAFVLTCSGVAVSDLISYSIGVVILMGVALFFFSEGNQRPRSWLVAYGVSLVLAIGITLGFKELYDLFIRSANSSKYFESSELSMETRTQVGQVTDLQQDPSIRWRLTLNPGEEIKRVRMASYNRPLGHHWRATLRPRGLREQISLEREVGGDFESLLNASENEYVFNEDSLLRTSTQKLGELRGMVKSSILLPVPGGVSRLGNVFAQNLAVNSMGTIQMNQPEFGAVALPLWRHQDGKAPEVDPFERDLDLVDEDLRGLDQFIDGLELGESGADFDFTSSISEERAQELVKLLAATFQRDFTYSVFSDYSRSASPISDFLNNDHYGKVGHCEYFASAATMLFRRMGIPARYCVGYSVSEKGDGEAEWILRGTHAHAWCQIYVGGRWEKEQYDQSESHWRCRGGKWVEIDLTPPGWAKTSTQEWWQRILDWWQGFQTQFILWYSSSGLTWVVEGFLAFAMIGSIIVSFIILMRTRGSHRVSEATLWEQRIRRQNRLKKFEKWLAKDVGVRPSSMPMSSWLSRHLDNECEDFIKRYEVLSFQKGSEEEWKQLRDRSHEIMKQRTKKLR